jgi:hypothetical protein
MAAAPSTTHGRPRTAIAHDERRTLPRSLRGLPAVTRLRELSVHLHRRALVILAVVFMVASVGVVFVQGAWAWGLAADRHRWARASVARESHLHQQLANRDAVLESQRRIYMERFRRLEAQLWERDRDVAVLRGRLVTIQSQRAILDQGQR